MRLSRLLLRVIGWKVEVTVPDYPKAIICVAPHTSNWDFVLGELAIHSVGRRAGFMMKASWFKFPLGPLFRALGGIPVRRTRKRGSMVESMIEKFRSSERLVIAITPEGTRSRVSHWHTGFLQIASAAHVPIELAAIDAGSKTIFLTETFHASGDVAKDIENVKRYYSRFTPLRAGHFSTAPQD